tara:strand:+ start:2756 stop:4603 length:1848 start_codon:yes stop_codon:yes gene_type:complete
MAKTNLNPGADATLVSAAYRSAAGNTPGDYSGALESVALGYEKTMEARSEMWGNIAKLGANIGSEMMANAEELTSYAAKASGLDADAAKFLTDEIYANKDAQKELGLFGGRFGDRETRKERAELKLKQKELFAEIDLAVESINVGADAIANGLYDAELANLNEGDAEKVNAIIKSNLKDKNTENGNYAKLGRDENTGELMYTLYDSNTNLPTMLNGKPQTMTIKEFNKSITNNVKDTKNVIGTNLGGIINDIVTDAQKGKNGIIDPQVTQMGLNRLDGIIQTDTDLRRAMLSKYGMKNTSFVDDLNNKGAVSANLYGAMVRSLGLGEGGQVPAEGAFEGIADTDNIKGLSLEEVNAAYGTYVNNIISMKDPEASKAAFKASFTDRMGGAHEYGYSKRVIKSGDKSNKQNPYGKGANISGFPSAGWQTGQELLTRRTQVEANQPFTGVAGKYEPQEDGSWILNGDTENPMSTYSVFDQEGLLQAGDTVDQYGSKAQVKEEQELDLKNLFMIPANSAKPKIEKMLPKGYTVSTSKSNWGKKGDSMPFFRSKDVITVFNDLGDEIGQYDVNYSKSPKKAIAEMNRFLEDMKNIEGFNTQTDVAPSAGWNANDYKNKDE